MDESDYPVSVGETTVIRETEKAILVTVDGEQTWVPKSVIHDDSEVWSRKNGEGQLVVKAWFAHKEGWE